MTGSRLRQHSEPLTSSHPDIGNFILGSGKYARGTDIVQIVTFDRHSWHRKLLAAKETLDGLANRVVSQTVGGSEINRMAVAYQGSLGNQLISMRNDELR